MLFKEFVVQRTNISDNILVFGKSQEDLDHDAALAATFKAL